MIPLARVALLLISGVAHADLVPDDVASCRDQAAGSTCTTDSGASGVCTETWVTRPDNSKGIPPGTKRVQMMVCVATGPAPSAKWSLLAALALLLVGLTVWGARGRRTALA